MSVGVVTDEASVMNPYYALGSQILLETVLNLLLSEWLIAVGSQQTTGCGEDGSSAVALNAATFEYEVQMGLIVGEW